MMVSGVHVPWENRCQFIFRENELTPIRTDFLSVADSPEELLTAVLESINGIASDLKNTG
jgi:hypothetical protein